jgi:solute:Na+ symporter, SSS family
MENVLELMLYSYAFMVSGLFVPLIAAMFFQQKNSLSAVLSMFLGGGTTITLIVINVRLPLDLDPNIFGITMSFITFVVTNMVTKKNNRTDVI